MEARSRCIGNWCIYRRLVWLFTCILLSSFQLDCQGITENSDEQVKGYILVVPQVDKPVLVSIATQIDGCTTNKHTSSCKNAHPTAQPRKATPTISKTLIDSLSCVRKSLTEQRISGEPQKIIVDSWRSSTKKQYSTYVIQWLEYCKMQKVDTTTRSLQDVLEFLTRQFLRLGYSDVSSSRSALSNFITINCHTLGDHPLISRFMSGLFNRKPALPRYIEMWDPQIILEYVVKLPENKDLELKLKLVILLLLTSAQRTQTVKALSTDSMVRKPDRYIFKITSLLKQTSATGGKQRHLEPIRFLK